MKIIPAIDLIQGKCVRLYQGDYQQITHYQQSPVALAKQYQQQGARCLHLVDLDGAKQKHPAQLSLISQICQAISVPVQAGGGIRSIEQCAQSFDAGIAKIVIGSLAVKDSRLVAKMFEKFGADKFVLALDVQLINEIPMVMSDAWLKQSSKSLWQVIEYYQSLGLADVLCTDIACDGTMTGPNLQLYRNAVERFPQINWQASGGIRSKQDLLQLAAINVSGAIIGRALYEGSIKLEEVCDAG